MEGTLFAQVTGRPEYLSIPDRHSWLTAVSCTRGWTCLRSALSSCLTGKGEFQLRNIPGAALKNPCGRATVGHNWAMGSFLECACFHFQEKRRACAHLQCLQQRVRISFQKWYLPLTLPSAARAIDNGRHVVRVPSGWSF